MRWMKQMRAAAGVQQIWLNIDLGELPDEDDALYAAAHIANIACGGHAGDAATVRAAVQACVRHQTAISAHPSFPDREGFGRRPLVMEPAALRESLDAQLHLLRSCCDEFGQPLQYLKAHGALYHQANQEPLIAKILLESAALYLDTNTTVIGPEQGALSEQARVQGLRFAVEGFADRGRRRGADGSWELLPRSEPGALLHDVHQVRSMVETLMDEARVQTVCLHGDHPRAVELAPAVRALLDSTRGTP